VSKLLFGAATAFALHLFGKDGRANWIAGRRPDTLRN
jgi:hypothetical protein